MSDPWVEQIGGDHYKKLAVQPTEYIMKNNMNFAEGCIVKYITRYKYKGGADDIRKIIHYARLILSNEYSVNE